MAETKYPESSYPLMSWENSPSIKTPLNADNLNHMDSWIGLIDGAVRSLLKDVQEIKDNGAGVSGVGIESIEQTVVSNENDGINEVTITLTDGTKSVIQFKNGSRGGIGEQGDIGPQGVGVSSIEQTTESSVSGGENIITITLTNGNAYTASVKNGDSGFSLISIKETLGFGTASNPIDLSRLEISSYDALYFANGTYYVKSVDLENISNLTFFMHEAQLIVLGDYFIKGKNCNHFKMYGGKINGNNDATIGVQLNDSQMCEFNGVAFESFGKLASVDPTMLALFGDCTGFKIEQCVFDGCFSGTASASGDFIHSYGVFINRLGSTKTYSLNGVVRGCVFDNITTQGTGDTSNTIGDGDGIFIQIPPYLDNEGSLIVPWNNIKIENCVFLNCKKRGAKIAARGTIIDNCIFDGEFWYACIDSQYGHNKIYNCKLSNKSSYSNSVTSALVASDGGILVRDSDFSARYVGANGYYAYHPAIRLNTRLQASVISDETPWDCCKIINCCFDNVSRGVYAHDSNSGATGKYVLKGLEVVNCQWKDFVNKYGVEIKSTIFSSVDVMRFIDFQFDYGKNGTEIKNVLGSSGFTYPYLNELKANYGFELYSQYWTDEPMSGYDNLPTCANAKIIYSSYNNGSQMGGILHKEYSAYGSRIVGTKDPSAVTSTLGKQLLYNSKKGDMYTNRSNGTVWVCTAEGTSSTIGTWTQL